MYNVCDVVCVQHELIDEQQRTEETEEKSFYDKVSVSQCVKAASVLRPPSSGEAAPRDGGESSEGVPLLPAAHFLVPGSGSR